MQQQIRQRDEDIAAKAAEIDELKERVAALEKLKEEQQSLISLKDSELAAAQQRLAEVGTAVPPTTPPATTQQASRQPEEAPQPSTAPVWWIALGVVAAALLAWLLSGRRKRKAPSPAGRRPFDSAALAASMAPPVAHEPEQGAAVEPPMEAGAAPDAQPNPPSSADAAPAWHAAAHAERAADEDVPPRAASATRPAPLAAAVAGVGAPTSAAQRFKLVRAFLDIGDDESARQLLNELVGDRDATVRNDATRMLRELG